MTLIKAAAENLILILIYPSYRNSKVYTLLNYPPLVPPPHRTHSPNLLLRRLKSEYRTAALVFQTLDSAIHWINHYPVDKY